MVFTLRENKQAFHNLRRCLQFQASAYKCAGIMAPGMCLVPVLMKGLEGNPQSWRPGFIDQISLTPEET